MCGCVFAAMCVHMPSLHVHAMIMRVGIVGIVNVHVCLQASPGAAWHQAIQRKQHAAVVQAGSHKCMVKAIQTSRC